MALLPLGTDDELSQMRVETVWLALVDLSAIFQALWDVRGSKQGSNSATYFDRCLPRLIDKWTSVSAWWTHELLHSQERISSAGLCISFLPVVVSTRNRSRDDPHREELAVSKYTLDLVFALLCEQDSNKYLPPADSRVDTSQDSRAFVDFLAFQYLTIPARKNAFLDRLRGMGGCRQKAIAEALVFRVEQLARTAEGSALRANARSMQLLLQFIAAITTNLVVWKALRAVSYLKLSAAALASIAKAIQADAGTHEPELTVNFHKCFLGLARCATFGGPSLASAVLDILSADDHFFKLANMAVPNSPQNPPEYLFEAIGELLPYIYSSATFHAIILAGHALRFRDTTIKPYEDRVQTKGLPLDTQDTAIDFAGFFSRPHEAYLYKPECHSLP
jgi:hypothetical protein